MYGEVTAASVSAFQSGNGLEETGEADAETLAKLFSDEAVNTDGEAVPMPSASASPTPSPAPEGDADTGSTAATDDAPPSARPAAWERSARTTGTDARKIRQRMGLLRGMDPQRAFAAFGYICGRFAA